MKKFELDRHRYKRIEKTNVVVYRIRYLIDIPIRLIKVGDYGGWIEKEENFSQSDESLILDEACVFHDAIVKDEAKVKDVAWVFDHAVIKDKTIVKDEAWVFGKATIKDYALIQDRARIFGEAVIKDSAIIEGDAHIYMQKKIGQHKKIKAGHHYD